MAIQKIFLAGRWCEGRGEPMRSTFPADGSLNAELRAADVNDVNEAVEAAERAWRDPQWRGLVPHQRAAVLYRVSDLINQQLETLAQLQTRDNGKPLAETRGLVASAAATARYFAAACEVLEGELPTQRNSEVMTLSQYQPLGVIAAITPWNSPIASEMQKVAPALAAGNAVILKPAEATPLMALKLAELFEQAGLPAGLLSVLPGKGSVIGEALARHPLVKKISFTGGTGTGRHLAHIAAEKLIPTSLELGGKSPTIVLEDADLEQAARGICYGIFSSAGQACIAGSRLFVHRSLYQPLLARLCELAGGLRLGDPRQPGVHMGPLINDKHRQSVAAYVALARQEGGRVLIGGEAPADPQLADGSYYLPTIIDGLSNDARVCQEEIFGPVLVAMPFDDEQQLVAMANDSVYGLAAGIWSRDFPRAMALAEQLETGTVWVNTYKTFSISTPFGGVKQSGLGREKGLHGIKAYMQQKSLYLALTHQVNRWSD
ncbi:aldehyde dehydrogenase [Serratia rubidaea]|uniref:Aldehyde dehydrogenase n=1 Tax=Serratia rubidaea TaxID=61652 RepID=A0A448SE28_SERRU|nr:aldehyde dehydrogenase [Serratia rubidaea]MBH1930557.1 aldehyde dehydrogenase [Serratia rubidaea]MCR1000510.1 aldehyde dehydrogenase [Serratia rubidaea]MDC6117658.1 aldehyde dehydrogenase [Serratia rubidaea]MEB7585966.1 aldehyde dehydrogenase [Serratia rubidaea]VEI65940.1 Betaine aldehyde dehydrogenase [Serratia rubidaea]